MLKGRNSALVEDWFTSYAQLNALEAESSRNSALVEDWFTSNQVPTTMMDTARVAILP